MKTYSKPDFFVTEFTPNESIAICPEESVYNEVTVSCVISGTHDIFYDKCDDNYNNLIIVSYNGGEYLVWANTNGGGGGPRAMGGSSTLQAILQAGASQGLLPSDAANNWQNYHAGLISPDIEKTRNSSI